MRFFRTPQPETLKIKFYGDATQRTKHFKFNQPASMGSVYFQWNRRTDHLPADCHKLTPFGQSLQTALRGLDYVESFDLCGKRLELTLSNSQLWYTKLEQLEALIAQASDRSRHSFDFGTSFPLSDPYVL